MSWAKIPIAWAKDPRFSDELRVFLAICDQTRAKGSALFRPEMVPVLTELPQDRVEATIEALIEFGAISVKKGRVTVHASRARVDLSQVNNRSSSQVNNRSNLHDNNRSSYLNVRNRSRAREARENQTDKIGFGKSFAEVNRIAAVRAKLIDEAKAFFLDPRWDQEHKRQRIGRRLMGICSDELMPESVREEIKEYMKQTAERKREQTKDESKGESDWH